MAFDPFKVAEHERGVVRVFTTDLEPHGNAAITPKNVQKLLGNEIELDAGRVEVFPSKMIQPIGLTSYLSDGHGIPESDLEGTAAALDALAGLVIVIPSSAFGGKAAVLEPTFGVRFVGAFHEPSPEPPRQMAEKEEEVVLSPKGGLPEDPFNRHGRGWVLALTALIAAAGLVLFAVF